MEGLRLGFLQCPRVLHGQQGLGTVGSALPSAGSSMGKAKAKCLWVGLGPLQPWLAASRCFTTLRYGLLMRVTAALWHRQR